MSHVAHTNEATSSSVCVRMRARECARLRVCVRACAREFVLLLIVEFGSETKS